MKNILFLHSVKTGIPYISKINQIFYRYLRKRKK